MGEERGGSAGEVVGEGEDGRKGGSNVHDDLFVHFHV